MAERDPDIVTSELSRRVTADGVTVEVNIYRLEHEDAWWLEVVNDTRTSIVWDDPFATAADAFAAFERVKQAEGMTSFLDTAKIIPFPKR